MVVLFHRSQGPARIDRSLCNNEEDFLTTFSSDDTCFRSCIEMSLQFGSADLFLTSFSVVRGGISLTNVSLNRGDFIFSKIWVREMLRFGKKPVKKSPLITSLKIWFNFSITGGFTHFYTKVVAV